MFEDIIWEIQWWQMWEMIAGRIPKTIKLAQHHRRRLKAAIDKGRLGPMYANRGLIDSRDTIFGMEIIWVR